MELKPIEKVVEEAKARLQGRIKSKALLMSKLDGDINYLEQGLRAFKDKYLDPYWKLYTNLEYISLEQLHALKQVKVEFVLDKDNKDYYFKIYNHGHFASEHAEVEETLIEMVMILLKINNLKH